MSIYLSQYFNGIQQGYTAPTSAYVIGSNDIYIYFVNGKIRLFQTSATVQNIILPSPIGRKKAGGPWFMLFNAGASVSDFNIQTNSLETLCSVSPYYMAMLFIVDPALDKWIYTVKHFS